MKDDYGHELLPTSEGTYPGYWRWAFKTYKNIWVSVDRIIGTSGPNVYRFHVNWTPSEEGRDQRYDRLAAFMSLAGQWVNPAQYNIPDLVKINDDYFVLGDGNRRVSLAHQMGIPKIKADVTEFFPGTRNPDL